MEEKDYVNLTIEEDYGEESRASSEPCNQPCETFRSYDSLEFQICSEVDEAECRLVKLNNTLKQLSDLIADPINREDTPCIVYLLCKFQHYNGSHGYYVKHLPQIGEVLEFVALRARKSKEYLEILYELLELCKKPLLLQRSSEHLSCARTLQRYFSLLGFLIILVPTKSAFLGVKTSIKALIQDEESSKRRDSVKLDYRREAVEVSRLPVTLDEIAEVVSRETYPDILEIVLALVSASEACCRRFLETGIVNRILLRMNPSYECENECPPNIDDVDLQLGKEDYYKSLEYSAKILWKLTMSRMSLNRLLECSKTAKAPSAIALRGLRAAFRREVLRAGDSSRSRKLRNELANLILANLALQHQDLDSSWSIIDSGIANDLADLVVATEFGTRNTWAESASIEVDSSTGLTFKKTLLSSIAFIADLQRDDVEMILRRKGIVSGVLRLVNWNFAATNVPWNPAQLSHLFKHSVNAVASLATKIAHEFIEDRGSTRLLSLLEQCLNVKYDEQRLMALAEMMRTISSADCEAILTDFCKHEFISVILGLIEKTLNFNVLTSAHQEIITFLLDAISNIIESKNHSQEHNSTLMTKTAIDLLQKCLRQKPEDSELKESFFVAIGSYIWKYLTVHPALLQNFCSSGGMYLILDLLSRAKLPVQSIYLGLLVDFCENEVCALYLFSWRCSDKRRGFVSLLANIWRDEEKTFGVERTPEGCIQNVESPVSNDEEWLYLYFTKSSLNRKSVATFSTGATRPKIYNLLQLTFRHVDDQCRRTFVGKLSLEDRITMLTIDAYAELKANEASLETSSILDRTLKTTSSLDSSSRTRKLLARANRVCADQRKLLKLERDEEKHAELEEFRIMRDARLNSAFDALTELTFIARTSCRDYLLEKTRRVRNMIDEETRDERDLCRTFDTAANFTTKFSQSVRVRSISKPSETKEVSMVSPSTSTLSPGVSLCPSTTATYDSSFFCQPQAFDERGNVRLKE